MEETVRCPICGEVLPTTNGGAEDESHLIDVDLGTVVCPTRVAEVMVA